jgi:hypothetical protein
MSTIGLTTFAIYRSPTVRPETLDGVEVLAGASHAELATGGQLELTVDSVPVHSNACAERLPRDGILMLYGRQDSMLELQRMRGEARRVGGLFAWADLEVDVGELFVLTVDREALRKAGASSRFLNFRRLHSSLQTEVLEKFNAYAAASGESLDSSAKREVQIASRPDLWDRLFRDDSDFQHIDVFVIPIADDPAAPSSIRYVSYARPGLNVESMAQGSDHVTLKLPASFTR